MKFVSLVPVLFIVGLSLGNPINACEKTVKVTDSLTLLDIAISQKIPFGKIKVLNANKNLNEPLVNADVCIKGNASVEDIESVSLDEVISNHIPTDEEIAAYENALRQHLTNETIENLKESETAIDDFLSDSFEYNVNNFDLNTCEKKCNYLKNIITTLDNDNNEIFSFNLINEIRSSANLPPVSVDNIYYNPCLNSCYIANYNIEVIEELKANGTLKEDEDDENEVGENEVSENEEDENEETSTPEAESNNNINNDSNLTKRSSNCVRATLLGTVNFLGISMKKYQQNTSELNAIARINGCSIKSVLNKLVSIIAKGSYDFEPYFTPACNGHDVCYSCGTNRSTCDDKFYDNMLDICARIDIKYNQSSMTKSCEQHAYWYHWGVKNFSKSYYTKGHDYVDEHMSVCDICINSRDRKSVV